MEILTNPLPARTALDRARRSRDPRFDGRFFVGVTSTGVYCRPVCPAPSPRDAHVRYFPSAAAAGEAGFRPCLRCRPEAAPGTPAWIGTSAVVRRALALVHEGALDGASVDALAARLGIGPRHLHRLFVAHVGAPPLAVAQTRRLHFAKRLIDETDLSMTEIAFASGFGSLRRFNDTFRKTYDRAPSALRRLRRTDAAPPAARPPSGSRSARPTTSPACSSSSPRARSRGSSGSTRRATPARSRSRPGPPWCAWARCRAATRSSCASRARPRARCSSLTGEARRAFDLAADPALIAAALGPDPLLGPLVRRRPGLRIPGAWDPFECAVRAVLGQQVSVEAGRTLARRLVARAGEALPRPTEGLTHLFPSPAALAGASLSGLGLTSARARALEALARAVADGRLDLRAPADEVTAGLAALPGIGDWTAQYVALRALGEPDAFPAGDLVLRRRAAGGGAALTARALAARAEGWRPWRGYAVLHLWSAAAAAPRRARKRRHEGE